jgi:hypothetical protein
MPKLVQALADKAVVAKPILLLLEWFQLTDKIMEDAFLIHTATLLID